MKLRNKKTGEIREIWDVDSIVLPNGDGKICVNDNAYSSLAELEEDWEDYEEPKEFWYIGQDGVIFSDKDTITQDYADRLIEIGNYFETEEEAEKAVEKLKAWKRLKDCGFKFVGWERDKQYSGDYHIEAEDYDKCDDEDLELLFRSGVFAKEETQDVVRKNKKGLRRK